MTTTAKSNRDRALKSVAKSNNAFIQDALQAIPVAFFSDETFTGEDIRRYLTSWNITPAHHNAWGAVVRTATNRGIIRMTGEYTHMKDPQSHARLTPVYRLG